MSRGLLNEWRYALGVIIHASMNATIMIAWNQFLVTTMNMNQTEVGGMMGTLMLLRVLIEPFLGVISDRLSTKKNRRARLMYGSATMMCVGFLCMWLSFENATIGMYTSAFLVYLVAASMYDINYDAAMLDMEAYHSEKNVIKVVYKKMMVNLASSVGALLLFRYIAETGEDTDKSKSETFAIVTCVLGMIGVISAGRVVSRSAVYIQSVTNVLQMYTLSTDGNNRLSASSVNGVLEDRSSTKDDINAQKSDEEDGGIKVDPVPENSATVQGVDAEAEADDDDDIEYEWKDENSMPVTRMEAFKRYVSAMVENPNFWIVACISMMMGTISSVMFSIVVPYSDVVLNADFMEVVAVFYTGVFVGMHVYWLALGTKLIKKKITAVRIAIVSIICQTLIIRYVTVHMFMFFLMGNAISGILTVLGSMIPDVIDECKTYGNLMRHPSAMIYASVGAIGKVGGAIGTYAASMTLADGGYGNEHGSDSALYTHLELIMLVIPTTTMGLCLLLSLFYIEENQQ